MSRWSATVVAALALLFALAADNYLTGSAEASAKPLLFTAMVVGLALFRPASFSAVFRFDSWWICLLLLLWAMVGFTGPGQDVHAWEALRAQLLAFGFVTAWCILLDDPNHRRAVLVALAVALACAVLMNLYEMARPLTWSSVRGRSAGTFVNPNLSALAILSLAALLATLTRRGLVMGLVLAVAGVGVFATFSRSGAVIWVCLTGYFLFASGRLAMRKRFAVFGLAVTGILALFFLLPDEIVEIPNVSQRLRLIEGQGFGDFSTDERAEVLRRGFAQVKEAPFAGHGPGAGTRIPMASGVLGAHNEYLSTWVSHGLVGLLLWCGFLFRLGRRRAAGFAVLLVLVSLSFHSLLLKRQLLLVLVAYEALVPLRTQLPVAAKATDHEAPALQPAVEA